MQSTVLSFVVATLTDLSNALFQLANSICARSQILDDALALPVNNQLVKAGLVGGCFLAAWYTAKDERTLLRSRRILLLALLASVFAVATTKTLSKTVFLPRPFIQSQKVFHLEGDQLVESRHLAYRVPLDEESQSAYQKLLAGDIRPNDLGSFPSDHAGFYVTLAAGIWIASRRLGAVALAWTFLVILGSRVIGGQHSPLDNAAGAVIGIVMLLACWWILGRWFGRALDGLVRWTMRHPVLSSVLIFAAAFEVANTLYEVQDLLRVGAAMGRQLFGA